MARRTHTVSLILNAQDRAGGVLGKFGGMLGRIGSFVAGDLLAGGLRATANAIGAIGRSAIEAVGNAQTLEMSLQGLLTESLMYEQAADGIYHQVLSFGDASELASGQVQDLLSYIGQTAIVSPFETTQVERVAQIGLAAHLSAEQVKEFTGAFLDYGAVHGITSDNLAFAAEQFLQLKQAGALTTIDLRQLRRLGIDVSRILGTDMSMSLEEATARFGELSPAAQEVFSGMDLDVQAFNEAAAESPEMIDAIFNKFIMLSEQGTAGAAQAMAQTLPGMLSTFRDIGEIGARNLFRPLIEAVSPTVAGILGRLSELATGPELAALGQRLGVWISEKLPLAIDYLKQKWIELQPALETIRAWLEDKLPIAAQVAQVAWDTTLKPALEGLAALARDIAGPALIVIVALLLAAAAPVIALGAALIVLGLLWRAHGEEVKLTVLKLAAIIVYFAMTVSQKVRAAAATWGVIMNQVKIIFQALQDKVKQTIDVWRNNFRMAGIIIEALRAKVVGAFNGIKAAIQGVIGRVQAFIDKVAGIELPDFLTPGSPTPFELGLRGIAAAMREVSNAAAPQFSAALAGGAQSRQSGLSSLQMGGDVINVTVNDRGSAALLMAMIEDRRRGRLNASMAAT